MKYMSIEKDGPQVLAAFNVFDEEGTLLGHVEHRETTVNDVRKGRVMGQKPAKRWFAAKPGEYVVSYKDAKYHTKAEAALSLVKS